jgi:hypothetical protein
VELLSSFRRQLQYSGGTMVRLSGLVCLTCVVLVVPAYLRSQDRAHTLASKAASQRPASCPTSGITLQQCHDTFPDGCSASARPKYDAYLDYLKDQDPGPTLASTKDLAATDFAGLESNLPQKLRATNHAAFANSFANLGEGNIHTVVAYLYFAEDTSKGTATQPANSETSNCKLTDPNTFDYHLGLGFDPALAASARTHPKPGDPAFISLEQHSVVAEMTPFTRHAKWTFDRVNALQGQQIKVVGQLMVDNIHFNKNDDCHFARAAAGCWRSTVWEIHPITQFYVCKASGGCTVSSPASDWTSLDDMP